jgi:ABC-type sulfate transport system permease subunit
VPDKIREETKTLEPLISLGVAIFCLFVAMAAILLIHGAFSQGYTYNFFGITSNEGGGAFISPQAILGLFVVMLAILFLGVIAGYGIGKYRYVSKR